MNDDAGTADFEHNLHLSGHDDGTWSFEVKDLEGNSLHSESGFRSQDEAQRAGIDWGANDVATRTLAEVFGGDK